MASLKRNNLLRKTDSVNAALISKINVIGAYHNALKPMRKEDDAETESLER